MTDMREVIERVQTAISTARGQSNPERRACINLSYHDAVWLEQHLAKTHLSDPPNPFHDPTMRPDGTLPADDPPEDQVVDVNKVMPADPTCDHDWRPWATHDGIPLHKGCRKCGTIRFVETMDDAREAHLSDPPEGFEQLVDLVTRAIEPIEREPNDIIAWRVLTALRGRILEPGHVSVPAPTPDRLHPSHKTRVSIDASSYDEICTLCGATDVAIGGWGDLAKPCPKAEPAVITRALTGFPEERSGDPADDGEALGEEMLAGLRKALGTKNVDPTADVVETVAQAITNAEARGWTDPHIKALSVVNALRNRGRLVEPGHVGVPAEYLKQCPLPRKLPAGETP